jgi:hypothetical protein
MAWTFFNSNGEALVQHAESEATQAEIEAETAGAKFVPPDLMKHHPGVAKVWCTYQQTGSHSILGTSDANSYNVQSVTDGTGAGDTDILWDTDFSSDDNTFAVMGNEGTVDIGCDDATSASGLTKVQTLNVGSNADQPNNRIVGWGAQ